VDRAVLQAPHALYQQARAENPRHWARHTRNWIPIAVVTLNPGHAAVIKAASGTLHTSRVAA
jgi:hypothetical protein